MEKSDNIIRTLWRHGKKSLRKEVKKVQECDHNIFLPVTLNAYGVKATAELDIVDGWTYLDLFVLGSKRQQISMVKHSRRKWRYCPLCGKKLAIEEEESL